jgi:hypothetical protein
MSSPTVAERDGIVLELTLDRAQAQVGDVVTAHVRLSNNGGRVVERESITCRVGPAPTIVIAPPDIASGRAWDGIAAEFKQRLLKESGVREDGAEVGFFVDRQMLGQDFGCTLRTDIQPFQAGQSDEMTLAWRVEPRQGFRLEPGPKVVRSTFSSASHDQTAADFELITETTLNIVGEPVGEELSIADYADAALSNAEFVSWLALKPSSTWINTGWVYWPTPENTYPERPPFNTLNLRPIVTVGLFRSLPGGEEHGGVVIDRATGEALFATFQ